MQRSFGNSLAAIIERNDARIPTLAHYFPTDYLFEYRNRQVGVQQAISGALPYAVWRSAPSYAARTPFVRTFD